MSRHDSPNGGARVHPSRGESHIAIGSHVKAAGGIPFDVFPDNVQLMLKSAVSDDDGILSIPELEGMVKSYTNLKKTNPGGTIPIDVLPSGLRPALKVFDVDGDGSVDPAELHRAAELYEASKNKAANLMKVVFGLSFLLIVLLGVNAALTAGVVEMSKDTKFGTDGTMMTKEGGYVTVASHEEGGALDSRLPDSAFNDLKRLNVTSPNGSWLNMMVLGTGRMVRGGSAYGTIVVIVTSIGTVEIDGQVLLFSDEVGPIFEQAGFQVSTTNRRLLGLYELQGFFNKLDVETSIPGAENIRPSLPATRHLKYTKYTTCIRGPQDNVDGCSGVSSGVVSSPTWHTPLASSMFKQYAVTDGELWATATQAVEVFTLQASMLPDLQYVKRHDVATGNFTGWTESKSDPNFCGFADSKVTGFFQSESNADLEAERYVVTYVGEHELPGTTTIARKFTVVDREGEWPGTFEIYETPDPTDSTTYRPARYTFFRNANLAYWMDFETSSAEYSNVVIPAAYLNKDPVNGCTLDNVLEVLPGALTLKQSESPLPISAMESFDECRSCYLQFHIRKLATKALAAGWSWTEIVTNLILPIAPDMVDIPKLFGALNAADDLLATLRADTDAVIDKYLLPEVQANGGIEEGGEDAPSRHRHLLYSPADVSEDSLPPFIDHAAQRRQLLGCCGGNSQIDYGDPLPCTLSFLYENNFRVGEVSAASFVPDMCGISFGCEGSLPPPASIVTIGGSGTLSWPAGADKSAGLCGAEMCVSIAVGCPTSMCGSIEFDLVGADLCFGVSWETYASKSSISLFNTMYGMNFLDQYAARGGEFDIEEMVYHASLGIWTSLGIGGADGKVTGKIRNYNGYAKGYKGMTTHCNKGSAALQATSGPTSIKRMIAGLLKIDHANHYGKGISPTPSCANYDYFRELEIVLEGTVYLGICFSLDGFLCYKQWSGSMSLGTWRFY